MKHQRFACDYCGAILTAGVSLKYTVTETARGIRRGQWVFCSQEHAWKYMARQDLNPRMMGGSLLPIRFGEGEQ